MITAPRIEAATEAGGGAPGVVCTGEGGVCSPACGAAARAGPGGAWTEADACCGVAAEACDTLAVGRAGAAGTETLMVLGAVYLTVRKITGAAGLHATTAAGCATGA